MTPFYFDYLATTPPAPEVRAAMEPFHAEKFGNASSQTHPYGWEAEQAVEDAREHVADLIGARPSEVFFSSGATESNNTVIQGANALFAFGTAHLVTTAIEHPSVSAPCEAMRGRGATLEVVKPGPDGIVSPDDLERAIKPGATLVSVMAVNNEIGTIQPIADVAARAAKHGAITHVDASQAVGKIAFDVGALGVDLASVSGHKLYAPKGIGVLYIREDSPARHLPPLLHGGGQERGVRAGTLAVAQIVGLGAAARLAAALREEDAVRIGRLRDALWGMLVETIPDVQLNGSHEHRIPGCLNFSVPGVLSDALIAGVPEIAISSGSACSSGKNAGSRVLDALGFDRARQRGAIRIGIGRYTTPDEVDLAGRLLAGAVATLRRQAA